MTDPLDDLKRAFDRATPEPDAERRKANLARAVALFDEAQESAVESRRTHDRHQFRAAIGHGVRHMLNALTSRPVLVAVGVLAAVGFAVLFLTLSRNTEPAPPVVVADTGAESEQDSVSIADPGDERPATAPSEETPPSSDGQFAAEAPTDPGREHRATRPSLAEIASPPDSEASEAVAVQLDRLPPVEEIPLLDVADAAQPTAEGRTTAVPQPTAPSALADTAIASLERRREVLRAELESLPGRGDSAGDAAVAREGELTVTGEKPLVDQFSLTAGTTIPGTPPAEAYPPPPVEATAAVSKAFVVQQVRMSSAPSGRSPADFTLPQQPDTEAFANEPANPVKVASEEPVSTFSIDVDTASYSVVRSSLMNGYLPAAESVRIEELVNYFPYAYPAPEVGKAPFRPTVTVAETPWNADTLLMTVGIQGRLPATEARPPLNLVFLIDTSGSMNRPNKLPLLKQSFRLMLGRLRPEDEVAIVTYAGSAGRPLDATPATERGEILSALDRLDARGSTAGAAGIQLAYQTAAGMAAEGEVTRVILATDGDFNVGISDPEQLKGFIGRQRDSGVYLSVLGFGRGNLDDATMQALAQNGNGQAAYIDTLSEAQKVLVDQLTGTLFPIADDVKIQVEFNPAVVAEYRLIGYETRGLRREDFNNDRVDAGEIGAGHSVTAIYEVTPVGSPAVLHDLLRYAAPAADPPGPARGASGSNELAFLRLRYKEPGEDTSRLVELPIARDSDGAASDQRFAAAIAGFGQLLRGGVYTESWTWADAIALAEENTGDDRYGYRREAVTLMRLAESLSE